MKTKQVNDLISLMAAVCCSEVGGSMCDDYSHQVNEFLEDYPEEIKTHFIDCRIAVSRAASVNKKPSKQWQSICDGIVAEKAIHRERMRIHETLKVVREQIIPQYLESEVAEFKGNTLDSYNSSKYLTDLIMNWVTAAVNNPDMVY